MVRFLVFVFMAFMANAAQCQNQLRFEKVKTSNFEKTWASAIAQDKEGFIWLGTQDGLYRYDGYDLKAFKNVPYNEQSLPGNWARHIEVNADGTFWIASYGGGLAVFDPIRQAFENLIFPKDANGTFITKTAAFSDNGLLLHSDKGVYLGKSNEHNFHRIPITSITHIGSMGETAILKSKDSLHFVANSTQSLFLPDKALASASVNDNLFLLSTADSLLLLDAQAKLESVPAPDRFDVISNSTGDKIYLASKNAFYSFDLETKTFLFEGINSFNNEKIEVLFTDVEGGIWVGTDKGFYRQKPVNDFLTEIAVDYKIRDMVYADSTLFMAGGAGFLLKKQNKKTRHLIKNRSFSSIAKVGDKIWLGNRAGEIYVTNTGSENIGVIDLIPEPEKSNVVVALAQDKRGRVWVGTSTGIYLLTGEGEILTSFKLPMENQIENQKIISVKIDTKDRLWVPTASHGLFRLDGASSYTVPTSPKFKHFSYEPNKTKGISSNIVIHIEESPDGTIWAAADNGLAYLKDGENEFEHLAINGVLFDEKIMTLKADTSNNLWIATIFNGLYFFNADERNMLQFTVNDGAISNAFLYNAIAFDEKNEQVFFGSDEGVQRVDTKKFRLTESLKPATIASLINYQGSKAIQLPIENTSAGNEITLSFNNRDVTLNFTNLDFGQIEKARYAYSLDAENWNPLPSRTAHLTNLSLRNNKIYYKSYLEGQNFFNSDFDGSINFYVTPPWYKTYVAYLLYVFVVVLVFGYLYSLWIKNKVAKQRVATTLMIEKTKSNLYANISHEFKTPLTVIGGLAKELLNRENGSSEMSHTLLSIERNNDQLLNLVSQMLDLVSLDNYQLEPNYKHGDLISFVKRCVEMFSTYAKMQNLELKFESNVSELYMDIDDSNLQKILNNLLSNAIKFTPSDGVVKVAIYKREVQNVILEISDSGKGIKKEELPKIFDRYYKTFDLDSNLGSGIGMELTKGLIEIMEGNISVESTLGEGTVFSISLPVRSLAMKSSFSFDTVLVESPVLTDNKSTSEIPELPKILLVEDNADIRNYVSQLLTHRYTIVETSNGKEALEILDKEHIDFILSDVVMPIMDGFVFCREVKKQMKISHIPFIMLTGKDDKESRLKGWKLGVDAYVSKPFDTAELLQLIETLIEKRKNQYQFYKQLIEANITEAKVEEVSDLEIQFIKAIQDFAFSSRSGLRIEDLAQELLMSRTQLHRKITQLSGMSITQYLNHIRMEKSKKMLSKTDLTVAEVAYEVGYEDPKYFSKIFKKEFGMPPSEYRRQ